MGTEELSKVERLEPTKETIKEVQMGVVHISSTNRKVFVVGGLGIVLLLLGFVQALQYDACSAQTGIALDTLCLYDILLNSRGPNFKDLAAE
jgi:hypothetical protein